MGISRGMRKFTLGPPFRKKKENNSQANSLIWLPLVIESSLPAVEYIQMRHWYSSFSCEGRLPKNPRTTAANEQTKNNNNNKNFPPKKHQPVTERAMSKKERKKDRKKGLAFFSSVAFCL